MIRLMVLLITEAGANYHHCLFGLINFLYGFVRGESMKKTLIMSLIAVSTIFYAHAELHIEQRSKNKAKDFIFSRLDQTCLKVSLGDTFYFCPPVTKSKITKAIDNI